MACEGLSGAPGLLEGPGLASAGLSVLVLIPALKSRTAHGCPWGSYAGCTVPSPEGGYL